MAVVDIDSGITNRLLNHLSEVGRPAMLIRLLSDGSFPVAYLPYLLHCKLLPLPARCNTHTRVSTMAKLDSLPPEIILQIAQCKLVLSGILASEDWAPPALTPRLL